MARIRTIDNNALLDAAERIAIRDGAAALSIDAVAREAGISKSRVIYDYKSKSGLLSAILDRRLMMEEKRLETAVEAERDNANPELAGRIALARQAPAQEDRDIAVMLSAALPCQGPLQAKIRDFFTRNIAAVSAPARNPSLAIVAFLALHGMTSVEYLDVFHWSESERTALLTEIQKLSDAASTRDGSDTN
ncbi:TetR/AcrR family transcriptional regulator [Rhizobium alvei]|uniref:Helix-turn-helix domain-containing protein n=1 Tax=Rhizobium alvei TaxID=1132659 RepID=A0ABT8YSV3_9HYPH|nr:TetR/AcrR family transcriptional regulator [Rhizobium alvei]MDO6966600.1 helix-turn-helix domain-containing protein [Rhizobium alvei]